MKSSRHTVAHRGDQPLQQTRQADGTGTVSRLSAAIYGHSSLFIVRLAIIAIALALTTTPAVAGHLKTDIATIDEGSILYGEIRGVKYATLTLKTDAAGTLDIEWRRITSLTSKYEYMVELTGGSRHYGTLEPPTKPKHLKVVGSAGTTEVPLSDVVRLAPIEETFFDRLKGSLNFGLTYTQSNGALQYNFGFDANYRSRKNYGTFSASSIFSSRNDVESTQQSNIELLLAQVTKGNWGPSSWVCCSQIRTRVSMCDHSSEEAEPGSSSRALLTF